MSPTDYAPVIELYHQVQNVRPLTAEETSRYDRLVTLQLQQEARRRSIRQKKKRVERRPPARGGLDATNSRNWRERNPEKYEEMVRRQRERREENRKSRLREEFRKRAEQPIPPIEVSYWLSLMAA